MYESHKSSFCIRYSLNFLVTRSPGTCGDTLDIGELLLERVGNSGDVRDDGDHVESLIKTLLGLGSGGTYIIVSHLSPEEQ